MNHGLTLYLSFPLFRLVSGNLGKWVWAHTLRVYNVFTETWSGSLAKRRLHLLPAGVINCTSLSELSFWVSLFPGTRGHNILKMPVVGEGPGAILWILRHFLSLISRQLVAICSSLVAQRLKGLPGIRETRVRSLGWEDPLEKEMATHSSTLAWRIPWREEPGRLQSMGSQTVGHDWVTLITYLVAT